MEGFDAITSRIDYPMYVVTVADRVGERAGCLVGFTTQCSIDPARFLVCLSKANHTFRVAAGASVVVVHVLPAGDGGPALAELFGSETGDEVDKFSRCAWRSGLEGVPVLEGAAAWFAARVVERVDLGDHVGLVVEPFDGGGPAGDDDGGPFLSFQAVRCLDPGHEA